MSITIVVFCSLHNFNHTIAERQAVARKARASEEVMKERMSEVKALMQEEKLSKREITYGEHKYCIKFCSVD